MRWSVAQFCSALQSVTLRMHLLLLEQTILHCCFTGNSLGNNFVTCPVETRFGGSDKSHILKIVNDNSIWYTPLCSLPLPIQNTSSLWEARRCEVASSTVCWPLSQHINTVQPLINRYNIFNSLLTDQFFAGLGLWWSVAVPPPPASLKYFDKLFVRKLADLQNHPKLAWASAV